MQKLRLLLFLLFSLSLLSGARASDVLILVQSGHSGEQSIRDMGAWLDEVRPGKYNIDFSADMSPNVLDSADSLSSSQMDLLNSYDLIIMPRYGVGGSSNFASTDWNDVSTPLILMNPFMVADGTRWGWVPGGTATPATPEIRFMQPVDPDSDYFDGIDPVGDFIQMYHFSDTTMQVEVDADQLTGQAIGYTDRRENDDWTAPDEDPDATPPELGDYQTFPWVVTWDGTEDSFFIGGTEAPGGPRTLFLGPLTNDPFQWRQEGMQIFVNAVSMILDGVSDPGGLPENPVADDPAPPFEGARVLFLTDAGEEDHDVHLAYSGMLQGYFPGVQVTRSSAYATDGEALSEEQIAELEEYHLIVMPRTVSDSAYDTLTWNDVATPILNHNPFYVRRNDQALGGTSTGWSWFHSTSSGPVPMQMMSLGEWRHSIFAGVDLPNDGEIQMFEEEVETRRNITTPDRILGNFLGATAQDARRSWISVWEGGQPFGTWSDDGTEHYLPIPAAARGQFFLPGDEGDVEGLTESGIQLLLNTANWLIAEKGSRYHMRENLEKYSFTQDEITLHTYSLSSWEQHSGWGPAPIAAKGSSTDGDGANEQLLKLYNDGFDATATWRPLNTSPETGTATATVDWSLKLRFNDLALDGVDTALVVGEDTGEGDGAANMQVGYPASIRVIQDGGAHEIRFEGGDGVSTAISAVEEDAWYQVQVSFDLDAQVFDLTVENLDNPGGDQSFATEGVSFANVVDRLDYFAIFSVDSSYDLDISVDDIFVVSHAPAAEVELGGFADWRETHFPEDSDNDLVSGPAADPDGDGVPNALEYVFGGNPTMADRSVAPVVERVEADGELYLQIAFSRDPNAEGVEVTVERATSLGAENWSEVAGPHSTESVNGLVREVWRDSEPLGAGESGFLRVRVELFE